MTDWDLLGVVDFFRQVRLHLSGLVRFVIIYHVIVENHGIGCSLRIAFSFGMLIKMELR